MRNVGMHAELESLQIFIFFFLKKGSSLALCRREKTLNQGPLFEQERAPFSVRLRYPNFKVNSVEKRRNNEMWRIHPRKNKGGEW